MTTARRSWDVDDHPTLHAVVALDELVLRNVAEGLRTRRLAPEVHAALKRAGVYRMLVPRGAGGDDLPYPTALRVIERLARVDGSVAWCAIIGAASNAFGVALPPGVAEATLWRDPDVGAAAVFMPNGRATPADGGYRVSGRWPFASGCTDAAWFAGQCRVEENGTVDAAASPPTHRMAVMPLRALRIDATWHATGLRATGSHDVEADDVFVPAERLERGADALLGSAVLELALIEAAERSARTAFFASVDALWDAVFAGDDTLEARSIDVQLASRHAVAQAVDVTSRAHRLGGAAALHEEHPLQRAGRDAQSVAQHGLFGLAPHEALGRTLVTMRMAPRDAVAA